MNGIKVAQWKGRKLYWTDGLVQNCMPVRKVKRAILDRIAKPEARKALGI